MDNKTTTSNRIFKILGGATALITALFLVWYFSSIVVFIIVSAVLAIMGCPLVSLIAGIKIGKWSVGRGIAAAITLVVIWAVFATLASIFIPLVFNKINQLSSINFNDVLQTIATPISAAQDYLNSLFSTHTDHFSLGTALENGINKLVNSGSINSFFSSLLSIFSTSVIALFSISFITYFFLKEENLFYNMVKALFAPKHKEKVENALDSTTTLLSRYFTGVLTESLIILSVISLVMLAFGMTLEDALFIGFIMGVMNVIPYAGPLMGGIISVVTGVITPIEGMTVSHTVSVIVTTLLIVKGIDDFILQPTIYSSRVKAHPLEIFLVISIAGSIAGILGMLLAIPSYTVIRVFGKEFFSRFTLVKQLTDNM